MQCGCQKLFLVQQRAVLINTGTPIHHQAVTNEMGSYYVTDLPPCMRPFGSIYSMLK
jgi:hypothetical protein